MHSDHEIEHLTEPWLEMVVLDQLVVQLEYNGQFVEEQSARERASSPASTMETPAEEALTDVGVDALEADAPEADAPASADSESDADADADTRLWDAAAWAARLCPSGGAPPSEAELDGALRARARRLARGPVHP